MQWMVRLKIQILICMCVNSKKTVTDNVRSASMVTKQSTMDNLLSEMSTALMCRKNLAF